MADQKLTALSAWTPALASLTYVVDDPSGTPVSRKATFTSIQALMQGGLTQTAGGADADQSMAVNTLYIVDISGYSADRTYTLPGTAAAGDRCGILLSAGDPDFELLFTAASGDTLIGSMGSIAGGVEYSRLFITGEVMVFRCTVANTTWVVEHDGRIPQFAKIRVSTQADGETANTTTIPTDAGGAWTTDFDNGNLVDTSTGRITMRRACMAFNGVNLQSKDSVTDATRWSSLILISGTERVRSTIAPGSGISTPDSGASCMVFYQMAVGDYMQPAYRSSAGAIGVRANTGCHGWVLESFLPIV